MATNHDDDMGEEYNFSDDRQYDGQPRQGTSTHLVARLDSGERDAQHSATLAQPEGYTVY